MTLRQIRIAFALAAAAAVSGCATMKPVDCKSKAAPSLCRASGYSY